MQGELAGDSWQDPTSESQGSPQSLPSLAPTDLVEGRLRVLRGVGAPVFSQEPRDRELSGTKGILQHKDKSQSQRHSPHSGLLVFVRKNDLPRVT